MTQISRSHIPTHKPKAGDVARADTAGKAVEADKSAATAPVKSTDARHVDAFDPTHGTSDVDAKPPWFASNFTVGTVAAALIVGPPLLGVPMGLGGVVLAGIYAQFALAFRPDLIEAHMRGDD